jgi:NTP pyrophosphatase (non-canonical NTP hydrolase)
MSLTVSDLVKRAYETAKEKGWHDRPATFGDRIALIHSEASEALEAFRSLNNDSYDAVRQPVYLNPETGNLTRDRGRYVPQMFTSKDFIHGNSEYVLNKPEGVVAELADIVIRVADLCGLYGIDLDAALEEKMAYNSTRPYRHGGKQL